MSAEELDAASASRLSTTKRASIEVYSGVIWFRSWGGERVKRGVGKQPGRVPHPFKVSFRTAMTAGVGFTVRGAVVGGSTTRGKSPKCSQGAHGSRLNPSPADMTPKV